MIELSIILVQENKPRI